MTAARAEMTRREIIESIQYSTRGATIADASRIRQLCDIATELLVDLAALRQENADLRDAVQIDSAEVTP